jgi:hypothetical protein
MAYAIARVCVFCIAGACTHAECGACAHQLRMIAKSMRAKTKQAWPEFGLAQD